MFAPALALLLVACATGGKLVTPKLTIVGAGMVSADVFSEQFRIRIHVENPNPHVLPVKTIEYRLFLEGDIFAEGTTQAPILLPANGPTEFDLVVHTRYMVSIGRLMSRIEGTGRRQVQYNFEGTVVIEGPHSAKIKFNEVGVVALSPP
jgi:LEA14-like dessication related protein